MCIALSAKTIAVIPVARKSTLLCLVVAFLAKQLQLQSFISVLAFEPFFRLFLRRRRGTPREGSQPLKEMVVVVVAVLFFAFLAGRVVLGWMTHEYTYHSSRAKLVNTSKPADGGQKVKLSRGDCFYRIDEPKDRSAHGKPLVVLVHGFVGCHLDYQLITQELVSKYGRRVLRMDNMGRGWSSLPNYTGTRCIPELYAGQLAELLFVLNETAPIDLVGYSMGGGIVATFADRFGRGKINSVTYLAGAGLQGMATNLPAWHQRLVNALTDLPLGFSLGLHLIRKFLLEPPLKDPSRMWDTTNVQAHSFYQEYYSKRIQSEPGLAHAALNTVKYYPFQKLNGAFAGVAEQRIPTLAVWGTADKLVPFRCAADLRSMYAQRGAEEVLTEEVYEGWGHSFPVECSTETAKLLNNFWVK